MRERPAFVIDAFAMMAFLNDEPGKPRVEVLLEQAKAGEVDLFMSTVNLAEVYYTVYRDDGEVRASEVFLRIARLPITFVPFELKDVPSVGKIKGSHSVSLGDAFAIALGKSLEAVILSGDPELRAVERIVTVEWLPQESP